MSLGVGYVQVFPSRNHPDLFSALVRAAYKCSVAGSYDAENSVLTITFFDVAAQAKYLNQVMEHFNAAFLRRCHERV